MNKDVAYARNTESGCNAPSEDIFSVGRRDFLLLRDVHSQHTHLQEESLPWFMICHRTVSMAAVYELKIKYDQDKFGVDILDAKLRWPISANTTNNS